MTSKRDRKCLTLEDRVKCLKLLELGKSSCVVAAKIGVGRMQVQNVLKRKREIMEEYESNGNLSLKRLKRDTEYSDINSLVYRWFLDATARLFPVSGPLIQEKARTFAQDLGFVDFKASNGWLESFLKRNNIVFKTQSGQHGEVKRDTVSQWKESIPSACESYAPENIFRMDETGLFYKDSTKSTFFKKGDTCAGGKRSKQRITVALCASMTGK
ncbi:tigger transposable element-derived protein 4-like [Mercenaria mercenaria]|uniref:tigger transposable element-derived protein 4-like n=1 Tax=Mercenaria mercenaria TaxID=6596 RepID=UPI00234E7D4E|nr:tigger transposable element-derived protein 4-like [Mercenaria mercenaria]